MPSTLVLEDGVTLISMARSEAAVSVENTDCRYAGKHTTAFLQWRMARGG